MLLFVFYPSVFFFFFPFFLISLFLFSLLLPSVSSPLSFSKAFPSWVSSSSISLHPFQASSYACSSSCSVSSSFLLRVVRPASYLGTEQGYDGL